MHKKIFLLLIACMLLVIARSAYAAYYSIQLKNGQEVTVQKYWEDGAQIRFYKDGGSVAVPKESINKIIKREGSVKGDRAGEPSVQITSPAAESEQEPEFPQAPAENAQKKELLEIKDRIDIIKSNLTTLQERKNFYETQRNAAVEVRRKAEERINEYRDNTYITSEDLKQNVENEQRKTQDAEEKIREADSKIMSLDEMIENQETMKSELEQKLK
jgi:hypothetical protein